MKHPELTPADVDAGSIEMLVRDNARMRQAGGDLAEAAIRVIHDYDGLHRLSLAVARWAEAIASEGDRHRPTRNELDRLLAHDIRARMSLREIARKNGVGVGQVRGAVARLASVDRNPKGEKPQALSAEHESAVPDRADAQRPPQ